MKKNTTGLNIIKYGELHKYYPLKFDTNLPFEDLCSAIANSSLIFKEEYQEKVLNSLGASLAQSTEKFNKNRSVDNPIYFKMDDFDKYKSIPSAPIDFQNQELRIELNATGASLKISVINLELEALENRIKRIQFEYDASNQFYGQCFVNSHERFLLLPLKIELSNKETVWLFAILYVFSNKMGILKLELPLVNIGSKPFKTNNDDIFISKVHCSWHDNFVSDNTLDGISKFYISTLFDEVKTSKTTIWQYNDTLRHIILIDFDGIPSQINNLSDILQEDIFRIISAPVPERPCTSYKKDAQEYLRNYSWNNHNVKYVLKTTGGCLSFVDQALLDYFADEFKKNNGIAVLDESDHFHMCNLMARDLQVNAELALLVTILKKMNNHSTIIKKMSSPKELSKIQIEYWENIRFICQLQEGCYGTVSEQITTFENMMPHYMKPDITEMKLSAIDNLLKEKQLKKNSDFQNFISIGGLLIAIFFGLPSIYETLELLRNFCIFIPQNIPYISLDNSSIFLWLLLNLYIFYRTFIKR